MAALPTYLPLPEAARRLGVPEARLRSLVSSGRMKAVEVDGEIAVSQESIEKRESIQSNVRKEDLPEYKKYSHLAGGEIGVNQAERKYNVPNSNISRWSQRGFVKSLGKDGQRILLDEQDIAYCAEIYHRNAGQGKWLFNKDGTPYVKH